jgi:hypothetical protein
LSGRAGTTFAALAGCVLVGAGVVIAVGALWPEDEPDDIVLIGDSLTERSEPAIRAAFGDDHLTIRAVSGTMFRDHFGTADQVAAAPPDVVVFNLGTNDVLCHAGNLREPGGCIQGVPDYDISELPGDMDAFVERLPEESCVIGLTVSVFEDRDLNELLEELEESGAIDEIADWSSYAEDQGDAGVKVIASDFIHLTDRGEELYAQFLREQVDELC